MQRSMIEKLLKWKGKPNRKPLVLYGVRQAGKTWLMKDFGAKHFKQTAYVSFDNNDQVKRIFNGDFDIPRIVRALSIETGMTISPDDTLIVFDEVQECPRALTSLKYFDEHSVEHSVENARNYHIIAAGSLLGVMSLEGTGFPVGKVDILTLCPMSFLEFLEAVDSRFVKIIKENDFRQLSVFHASIIDLLQQYLFVGGMPAAVKKYAETRDFSEVREVQKTILDSYYADFAKHIPATTIAKVRAIWDSAPVQLAKENKRFLYSDMKQGSRGREYEIALQWLKDSGLLYMLNRVSLPKVPLIAYREMPIFKLYMPDVGLLSARSSLSQRAFLETDNNVFSHYKGVLAEQFVLQELLAAYDYLPVYYWAAEKKDAEIEFVIQSKNAKEEDIVIPLEVKAGKNIRSESLKMYRKTFNPEISVRSSLLEYSRNKGNYEIPLYMVGSVLSLIMDR